MRLLPVSISLLSALLIGGCAVQPKAFNDSEITNINRQDFLLATQNVEALSGPVSLDEAIARALKYNLKHRTRLLEQSLAAGELEAGRFDMLPKLLADAGYSWRNNDPSRTSESNPTVASVSSEKAHVDGDVALMWNVLDFGASYYNAKQNADRLLIANERRRKAMHTLIQNVRTSYWRALAAQLLTDRLKSTIADAEKALKSSRQISAERVKDPKESLRYQRTLLENLRLLESVERELASAKIELADYMGLTPGQSYSLAGVETMSPAKSSMTIEEMEQSALLQNADLRESFYNVRIAADDTRKALLKLLPGISFEYSYNFDDDKYLVNDQWNAAGARVSYNLFNILSGPSRMDAAEKNEQLQAARRMALQMSVLTQVHLANHEYLDAKHQFERAESIYQVDKELADVISKQQSADLVSDLDRISANVTYILSTVRLYQAVAKVQEAESRVQATLGFEPVFESLDDLDLQALRQAVRSSLDRWSEAK